MPLCCSSSTSHRMHTDELWTKSMQTTHTHMHSRMNKYKTKHTQAFIHSTVEIEQNYIIKNIACGGNKSNAAHFKRKSGDWRSEVLCQSSGMILATTKQTLQLQKWSIYCPIFPKLPLYYHLLLKRLAQIQIAALKCFWNPFSKFLKFGLNKHFPKSLDQGRTGDFKVLRRPQTVFNVGWIRAYVL